MPDLWRTLAHRFAVVRTVVVRPAALIVGISMVCACSSETRAPDLGAKPRIDAGLDKGDAERIPASVDYAFPDSSLQDWVSYADQVRAGLSLRAIACSRRKTARLRTVTSR
jgi:hypothetical protein